MSKTRNVHSPKMRLSFPNLFKPRYNPKSKKEEFSMVGLFAKDLSEADKKILSDAYAEAVREQWGDKPPKNLRKPFRNQGDRAKENEQGKMVLPDGYVDGAIYINFKSNRKPAVVNQKVKPILDETELYAGCYVVCTFNAVAYDMPENKGVSFYLVNVQKVAEGEPFGNLSKPEDSFKPIEDDETSVSASTSDINSLL